MRLSPSRRLDRALDALLPPHSTARRVRDLPAPLKIAYAQWQQRCSQAVARYADRPPGWRYEQMLETGEDVAPPLPPNLREALGNDVMRVSDDLSLEQVADLYAAMLRGEC